MRMQPIDIIGSLYSSGGLRFGGFRTSQFLELTEYMEELRPGVREEIIGESNYLAIWPHRFPELAFFIGTLFSKSLFTGSICFVGAVVLETFRFYFFGASSVISNLCKYWNWIKFPLFLITAVFLWSEGNLIPVVFVLFLVLQGWLGIISNVIMLPVRFPLVMLLSRWAKHTHAFQEALALQFVIDRWRKKLLPLKEEIQSLKDDEKLRKDLINAVDKYPILKYISNFLGFSSLIFIIIAITSLIKGDFIDLIIKIFFALALLIIAFLINLWAAKHPK
ncbi:MAG: hypothetical protein SNJ71_03535 [Bacteroidales bacterium]